MWSCDLCLTASMRSMWSCDLCITASGRSCGHVTFVLLLVGGSMWSYGSDRQSIIVVYS